MVNVNKKPLIKKKIKHYQILRVAHRNHLNAKKHQKMLDHLKNDWFILH
jgi:hypothetical protein